jgi:uncharacterized protein YyaL (SSP411 family)
MRRPQDGAREPRAGTTTATAPASSSTAKALAELKERFDPEFGGFGPAPKFPHATDLELCLREHLRTNDATR